MVGYSLHQLLRYMAAHSGWHLLLPVRGDSQRVPNGAEALGEWVDGGRLLVRLEGSCSTAQLFSAHRNCALTINHGRCCLPT